MNELIPNGTVFWRGMPTLQGRKPTLSRIEILNVKKSVVMNVSVIWYICLVTHLIVKESEKPVCLEQESSTRRISSVSMKYLFEGRYLKLYEVPDSN